MFRLPFNNFQLTGWGFPSGDNYVPWPDAIPPSVYTTGRFLYPAKSVEGNFLASKFLPADVGAGGVIGFTWNTPEQPPSTYVNLSGQLEGTKDVVYYGFTLSGGTFPHVQMSGNLYAELSGAFSGNIYDNVPLFSVVTGECKQVPANTGNFYVQITGAQVGDNKDIASGILAIASGDFNDQKGATGMLYCSFRGGFTAPYRDTISSLYLTFEAIDYENSGPVAQSKLVSGTGMLYMRLTAISYSN